MSRNADKGREAENATADVFRQAGFPHAERRAKRGGFMYLDCACQDLTPPVANCHRCGGQGFVTAHRDAGDLAGIPDTVVQVKWSPYAPLVKDLAATERQRRVAGARVGLLVVKRRGVGVARAAEWDAYLPTCQLAELLGTTRSHVQLNELSGRVWRTDLWTAARLIRMATTTDRSLTHA